MIRGTAPGSEGIPRRTAALPASAAATLGSGRPSPCIPQGEHSRRPYPGPLPSRIVPSLSHNARGFDTLDKSIKGRLFTILSALSLILCIAAGAIWVRSYRLTDSLTCGPLQLFSSVGGFYPQYWPLSSSFGRFPLVSDFELRASDFPPSSSTLPPGTMRAQQGRRPCR
jgi:hypothetical protein